MGIGAGLIQGTETDLLVGYREGDLAYEAHSGAVYHPQDEGGGGNVAFYEIQNQSDQIDLSLRSYIFDMAAPAAVFYTAWGDTDFDIIDRDVGNTLISEQSGFDSTGWVVNLQASAGNIRITNFDSPSGIDGTQAGWYPFVSIFDRK